jgi:hypothetical protein
MGPREIMRRTKLSQKAVYAVLNGERVRQHTLDIFKRPSQNKLLFRWGTRTNLSDTCLSELASVGD